MLVAPRSPDCAARAAVSGAYASLGQVLRTPSLPGETDSSEWTRLLPMISVLHLLCRSGETDSHMDFVMSGGLLVDARKHQGNRSVCKLNVTFLVVLKC